jgi:predicted metal-dependent phosphoesterase TrpH/predicted ATP-grasp superfamily ATP-dependent carboligase
LNRTVIITDTQYRAAASIARELGRAGFRVLAAYDGGDIPVSARSRYVSERIKLDAGTYADSLLKLAEREDAVIFPAGARTTEIMAARHADFSRFSLFPDAETLRRANDKRQVASLARSLGIRTPREFDVSDIESGSAGFTNIINTGLQPVALSHDVIAMARHRRDVAHSGDFDAVSSYPAVIKYVNGESLGIAAENRYEIARNRAELDAAARKMAPNPYFVSEYITGAGYGVSVLLDKKHRAVRVFCHERLREYPLSGGPSVKCRSVWNENMARDAVKLLRALDFEGIAMVEFKGTPEDYAVLEINPRVWGSYPLSHLAGAGFAEAFARAAAGESLPEPVSSEYNTGVRMQYFLSGARWAAASARESKSIMPLLRYAADILDPRVKHGLWSRRDPLPGICYLLKMARRGNGSRQGPGKPLRPLRGRLPCEGRHNPRPCGAPPSGKGAWGLRGTQPPSEKGVPRRGGGCPLCLDLHTHSNYSHDGVSTPREIIAAALAAGLDGVAICDHNIFRAYDEAKALAPEGFVVIPGVEYSTDFGHVLALFVSGIYNVKYGERGLCSLSELRAAADADGALLVAAHPFRHRGIESGSAGFTNITNTGLRPGVAHSGDTPPPELFELTDGVETLNSRDDAREPQNEAKAIAAAEKYGKFIIGGSDAHIPREIGARFTVLPAETERTPEAVRAALINRLSSAGGPGGRLIDQATAKLRRTSIKRLPKDIARIIYYTLERLVIKWH